MGNNKARCILWPEVYDEDGKVWRYAERQYSYMCNDIYKQALIDALIQAGEIEAKYNLWYGKANVNKGELETAYELAREDIFFFDEEKQRKTTKVLNK